MIPAVTFGDGYAKRIDFTSHADSARSYSTPRETSSWTRPYNDGPVTAWMWGFDNIADLTLRYIPLDQWDGPNGVKMWIAQAMRGRPFRFYPDRINRPGDYHECVLMSPDSLSAYGRIEVDGSKALTITIRTIDKTYIEGY